MTADEREALQRVVYGFERGLELLPKSSTWWPCFQEARMVISARLEREAERVDPT